MKYSVMVGNKRLCFERITKTIVAHTGERRSTFKTVNQAIRFANQWIKQTKTLPNPIPPHIISHPQKTVLISKSFRSRKPDKRNRV